MRKVKYAGIQMQCTKSVEENIAKADKMVRKAAAEGAKIILLPELFERQYFCQERNYDYYLYARSLEEDEAVNHFKKVAAELEVVLPISFYEKDVNVFYNTTAVIDAGTCDIVADFICPLNFLCSFTFTPFNLGNFTLFPSKSTVMLPFVKFVVYDL